MPEIELQSISNYGCRNLDLKVAHGEILALLGPNGAGKTTLLNVIAGFCDYSGKVLMDGRDVDHLDCLDRGVGVVFQELALFPHMTGFDNVAFGLRMKGAGAEFTFDKVNELLELTGVSYLSDRYPGSMSGGEKQRIALARALAVEPEILLLDEPFAKLDPPSIRPLEEAYFSIIRRLGLTALMVTHNMDTAFSTGDRVAVLNEGVILQQGLPGEVFKHPKSPMVANFMDLSNIYSGHGKPSETGEGLEIQTDGPVIHAASGRQGRVSFSIRPDDILLSREPVHSSARNSFQGIILSLRENRHLFTVEIHAGIRVRAVVTRPSMEELNLRIGDQVYVTFKASAVHIFL